jgi:microcystin-dependent protein
MAEPFLGEIRAFGFNFAPAGWAKCEGQLLPISQNTALFSLLGNMYGGDGKSTFALPDLRGRVAIGVSATHAHGQAGGEETHTLSVDEMPAHTHVAHANTANGNANTPQANVWASNPNAYRSAGAAHMDPNAIASAGGGHAHNTMQPFLALNYCIALFGDFPPHPPS